MEKKKRLYFLIVPAVCIYVAAIGFVIIGLSFFSLVFKYSIIFSISHSPFFDYLCESMTACGQKTADFCFPEHARN